MDQITTWTPALKTACKAHVKWSTTSRQVACVKGGDPGGVWQVHFMAWRELVGNQHEASRGGGDSAAISYENKSGSASSELTNPV